MLKICVHFYFFLLKLWQYTFNFLKVRPSKLNYYLYMYIILI